MNDQHQCIEPLDGIDVESVIYSLTEGDIETDADKDAVRAFWARSIDYHDKATNSRLGAELYRRLIADDTTLELAITYLRGLSVRDGIVWPNPDAQAELERCVGAKALQINSEASVAGEL